MTKHIVERNRYGKLASDDHGKEKLEITQYGHNDSANNKDASDKFVKGVNCQIKPLVWFILGFCAACILWGLGLFRH
jgi:hypothetical protein